MATINDVAERAGVSLMTVSRVMNGSDRVSRKTREKVETAVAELDYHPNLLAKGLATGNSQMFAYVVPDLSDHYFGAVMKSAQRISLEEDYSIVFFSAENDRALDKVLKNILRRSYDGVVIHDQNPTDGQLSMILKAGVSCVLIDNERKISSDDISTIDIDHFSAAAAVARILLSQGYRRLACAHGMTGGLPEEAPDLSRRQLQRRIWRERLEGFRSELSGRSDVEFIDIELELEAEKDISFYSTTLGDALTRYLDEPIAVFCAEDTLALALRGYMQEHGVEMPGGIAIFGTDGLDNATKIYPRISTVVHPRKMIGETVVRELIATTKLRKPHRHLVITPDDFFCGDTTYPFSMHPPAP